MAVISGKSVVLVPKPCIRKASWSAFHNCDWKCTSGTHGGGFVMGLGKTPKQAYDDWLYNFLNKAVDKGGNN